MLIIIGRGPPYAAVRRRVLPIRRIGYASVVDATASIVGSALNLKFVPFVIRTRMLDPDAEEEVRETLRIDDDRIIFIKCESGTLGVDLRAAEPSGSISIPSSLKPSPCSCPTASTLSSTPPTQTYILRSTRRQAKACSPHDVANVSETIFHCPAGLCMP